MMSPAVHRALRITGITLAGGLLLLMLALGGGLLFLHTSAGGRLAADAAVSALQQAGIRAELDALEGLPFSARLSGLRLADGTGVWLDIPSATLSLAPLDLLRGHLTVRELSLEGELSRLPALPPSAGEPGPSPALPERLSPEDLGRLASAVKGWLGRATVDSLDVRNFRIGPDVAGIPLDASVHGGGALTDFAADLRVVLLCPGRAPLEVSGTLHAGSAGSWLEPAAGSSPDAPAETAAVHPDVAAALDLSLGGDAGQKQPASLHLLALLSGPRLCVHSLTADVPGGHAELSSLSLEDARIGGTLSAALSDPAALSAWIAALAGQTPALPLASADLSAEVSGTPDAPSLALNVSASFVPDGSRPASRLNADASGTIAAAGILSGSAALTADATLRCGGEAFVGTIPPEPLHVSASAALSGSSVTVDSLRLEAPWLAASGKASLDLPGKIDASVQLNLPQVQAFVRLPLASVSADSPLRHLSGAVRAAAELHRGDAASPVTGTADLGLDAMHWGMPQLQNMLGSTAALDVSFELQPETGAAALKHLSLKAGKASAEGTASLADGRVAADVSLTLASLSGIDPALSGPLKLALRASGPLAAPGGELTVSSPRVGIHTATLEQFELRLRTPGADAKGGKGSFSATALLSDASIRALRAAKPIRMAADWQFSPERFSLRQTRIEAPGLALSGALEASSDARRLDGGFSLSVTDWSALSSLAGLPLRGTPAAVSVAFASGKTQQLKADWTVGELGSSAFSLHAVQGHLAAGDVFGKGALELSTGFGIGSAGALRWRKGSLNVSGTFGHPQLALSLQGETAADIVADVDFSAGKAHVARCTLTDRRNRTIAGIRLNRPLSIGFSNGFSVDNLNLSILPQGVLTAQGSLDRRGLSLEARVRDVAINMLRLFTETPVPDGLLNASLALSGTPSRPQGTLELALTRLAFPGNDMPPASLAVDGQVEPAGLLLHVRTDGMGTSPATGTISLPLTFSDSGVPAPALNRPLAGRLSWEGALASLWRFVPLANTSLNGQGLLDATLSGTLAAPSLSATVRVEKGTFEDMLLGLSLSDIRLDASLLSDGLSRLSLSATDGRKGKLDLSGTIGSLGNSLPLSLHGRLSSFAPLHRNDLSLTLSGTADILGSLASPDIRAAITVDKGQFDIVSSFGTNIPTLPVVVAGQEAPPAPVVTSGGPRLDVAVTLPGQFFVRGKGLESEWKGRIQAVGPVSDPEITGAIHSVRGQFALLGKEFTLRRGEVEFSGATPPDPRLNVLVTYAAANITAEATVSGLASSPTLTLSSQPGLPQDEIVAQVLFGKSASSLGRVEAIQLAAEVASLSGFGSRGFGVLGEVRQSLGFDVLRFGSMQTGQSRSTSRNVGLLQPAGKNNVNADANAIPSLEVGKYVMDNVYVGVEQGMNGDATGVRVEIELAPSLNLEGVSTPERSEVGLNWKKDY